MGLPKETIKAEVLKTVSNHAGLSAAILGSMINADIRVIRACLKELETEGALTSVKRSKSASDPARWFVAGKAPSDIGATPLPEPAQEPEPPATVYSDPAVVGIWGEGPEPAPSEPAPPPSTRATIAQGLTELVNRAFPEAEPAPSEPEKDLTARYWVRHLNKHMKPVETPRLHMTSFSAARATKCGLDKTAPYARPASPEEVQDLDRCSVCFGRISRPVEAKAQG